MLFPLHLFQSLEFFNLFRCLFEFAATICGAAFGIGYFLLLMFDEEFELSYVLAGRSKLFGIDFLDSGRERILPTHRDFAAKHEELVPLLLLPPFSFGERLLNPSFLVLPQLLYFLQAEFELLHDQLSP